MFSYYLLITLRLVEAKLSFLLPITTLILLTRLTVNKNAIKGAAFSFV